MGLFDVVVKEPVENLPTPPDNTNLETSNSNTNDDVTNTDTEVVPQPDETQDWNKDSAVQAYRKKQSEAAKLKVVAEQEREARLKLEAQMEFIMNNRNTIPLNSPAPVVVDPEPPEPAPLQPKPKGYSRADALADPNSDSAKWQEHFEEYTFQKDARDRWEKKQTNAKLQSYDEERETTKQQTKVQQVINTNIGKIMSVGVDKDKAVKVERFIREELVAKDDIQLYVALYDLKNGISPQQNLGLLNSDQRKNRQASPISPAVLPGDNGSFDADNKPDTFYKSERKNLFETKPR